MLNILTSQNFVKISVQDLLMDCSTGIDIPKQASCEADYIIGNSTQMLTIGVFFQTNFRQFIDKS